MKGFSRSMDTILDAHHQLLRSHPHTGSDSSRLSGRNNCPLQYQGQDHSPGRQGQLQALVLTVVADVAFFHHMGDILEVIGVGPWCFWSPVRWLVTHLLGLVFLPRWAGMVIPAAAIAIGTLCLYGCHWMLPVPVTSTSCAGDPVSNSGHLWRGPSPILDIPGLPQQPGVEAPGGTHTQGATCSSAARYMTSSAAKYMTVMTCWETRPGWKAHTNL